MLKQITLAFVVMAFAGMAHAGKAAPAAKACSHMDHTVAAHKHGGPDCKHEAVKHGDHTDYKHDGHMHKIDGDHYDECKG